MYIMQALLAFLHISQLPINAPSGFPSSGNGLWYTQPGREWAKELLPAGNGYLGAMIPGGTIQERTQLNIETLWSGGKFDDPYYNGGNKEITQLAGTAQIMQSIRETIFLSPTADIDSKTSSFYLTSIVVVLTQVQTSRI